MTRGQALIRLYPPAVRERWGLELEQQVTECGLRSWPNTILGAAALWARPALWPHSTAMRSRRTVSTLAFAVIVLTTLVLRAAGGQAVVADPRDPSRSVWFVLVTVGLLAAAPIPLLHVSALRRLVVTCVRTLGPPLLMIAAMVALANSGLAAELTAVPDAMLVAYYWAALAFGGHRACVLVDRLSDVTRAPSVSRLRLALTLIGAGLALAICQLVTFMVRTHLDAAALLAAIALIGFVAVTASAAHDLGTVAS